MSFFEIFSALKEDIRQLYVHYVHTQKDLDFELGEDLKQFDGEEFKKNDSVAQIDGLILCKVAIPEEYSKQTSSQAFNQPLVQLLGFNTVMTIEAHFVVSSD